MIKKKVCMLGAFAVGKTSLVQQFAHGLFSEKYHTTVGVRIEKKALIVDAQELLLLIWDLHGEDGFQEVRTSYLRGAAGCFYVVDGTRRETVETAVDLHTRIEQEYPGLPAVALVNKADERSAWEVSAADLRVLRTLGVPAREVSAKTADGVEEAFAELTRLMMLSSER